MHDDNDLDYLIVPFMSDKISEPHMSYFVSHNSNYINLIC